MSILSVRPLFNPQGGTDKNSRKMIGGNTTNLNGFNNIKYTWAGSWYRQAMSDFWTPKEANLNADLKDYKNLATPERATYDRILSFLVFSDSIQTANLPCAAQYITASEVDLCPTIQGFQEAVHSQSYSYVLGSIYSPVERDRTLHQWREDEHPPRCSTFIGDLYNEFQEGRDDVTLLRVIMANYILEGIYLHSGFMFLYSLRRGDKMPGNVQEIRYVNRDENIHLWLFHDMIGELRKEEPQLFTPETMGMLESILEEGVTQEVQWGSYVIDDDVPGLTSRMVTDYIRYLGNLRWSGLSFGTLHEGYDGELESMKWVNQYPNVNMVKVDPFEAKSTTCAKSAATVNDL